jgi:TolB-like protein/Flp pilus assembly protein TadD
VRLADFGIARAVSAAGGTSLTATGIAIGTPTYMSPEQASGAADLDARTDVYSLACVAYEMLAGEPPYTGATVEAILARKSRGEFPRLDVVRETVPPAVEQAIRKALARVPADRFATASQFAEALGSTPPSSSRRLSRRWFLGAAAVATVPAVWAGVAWLRSRSLGIRSLAVLPFANQSGDAEQEYFAVGMTEELIARLSAIGGLTVKSRTSVMRYQDSDDPIPAIARALGVDALVEGSVARSPDRVRIRARLVQARPERSVWSQVYDRDLADVLELQGEVARTIANEIGVALTPLEEHRQRRASAVDPAAADAYFKGRFYWNRRTGDALLHAITHFEQAIAIAPGYARAHVGLADCYVLLAWSWMSVFRPADALGRARAAALTALEIDEGLAEAHASLGNVETYSWNWDAAESHFRRALALDPDYGTTCFWYAVALAAMGRIDEAVSYARRAQRIEPVSPIITAGVAWMLHLARRYEEAIEQARRCLTLEPGFAIGHVRLGVAYRWLGRFDDAIREIEAGLRASGGNPGYTASLAQTEAAAGRRPEARRRLRALLEEAERRYVPAYSIATVHIALGDRDAAFDWLERAFDEHSVELTFIGAEPEVDAVRADPRFHSLLRRMNLPR